MSERTDTGGGVRVGGGAAGGAAALAAAARGCKVTLVRRAPGTTALSSGAVDLAADPTEMPGDPWQDRAPTSTLLRTLQRLEPRHPLALTAVDAARSERILQRLCDELELLVFRPLDNPALVLPTDLGTFKSTTLCHRPALGGHLPDLAGARLGVVGFQDHPLVEPRSLALGYERAAARGGVDLRAVPLEVPVLRRRGEQHLSPPALAAHVDLPHTLRRLTEALDHVAKKHDLTHLVLPPVMGMARWSEVMGAISRVRPAFEMLASSPPAVPGLRLQQAMDSALARHQVHVLRARALGFNATGGRVTSLKLEDHPPLEGDAFVLATGKFASGGLVHERSLEEPLFGLPVWIGPSLAEGSPRLGKHLAREVAGPHPLMTAGVRTDRDLIALGRDLSPAWGNLFAAGSVLGGYDYITGRCGLGTALITGHLAGSRAGGERAGGEP